MAWTIYLRSKLRLILSIAISVILLLTSCGQNLYKNFNNPYSDPALYQDAIMKMNIYDWDGALTDFAAMSTGYRSSRSVAKDYAGALAGKCGLDFMTFFNSLGSASIGTGVGQLPFFNWLMNAYNQKTVTPLVTGVANPVAVTDSYCSWSQDVMDQIQTTYGAWTVDEKWFVLVLSLAKIGIYLRSLADIDGVGSLGNGVIDATFDGCSATSMKDFYANQIVTGFALVINNFTGLLGGALGASLGGLQTLCQAPPTGLGLSFCAHTTVATVTLNDRKNIRGMLMLKDVNGIIDGMGLQDTTAVSPIASVTPNNGATWQCNLLAGVAPPPEFLLGCCP